MGLIFTASGRNSRFERIRITAAATAKRQLPELEVSKEDLETAKMNLQAEHYRAANNRAYYSIYHAVTAVLALENVSYKRHKDTIANFNKNYIKTEIFPRELGRRISKAEIVRHDSDYNEFYLVTKDETKEQIEPTQPN